MKLNLVKDTFVVFKHRIAWACLHLYLIADFLSSAGCFLEPTAARRALRSGRRHARLLLAARGRAWTQSACLPVTPAARQTAKASLPLTAQTPSRTRWVITKLIIKDLTQPLSWSLFLFIHSHSPLVKITPLWALYQK